MKTQIEKVKPSMFPELQGWKEKQMAIVRDNPFVHIEDSKTYEEAKKNRTTLVSARTAIQGQDKTIASRLKELRSKAGELSKELIDITLPHEEKQQEEVRRYEAIKEAEKAEKERIEQERKDAIQKHVNEFYALWKTNIANLQFAQVEQMEKELSEAIEEQPIEELEEFELDWAEKISLLNSQIAERVKFITEQENARAEREALAKEKAAFEEQQKQAKAKADKEQAERESKAAEDRKAREVEEAKTRKQREAEQAELETQRKELAAEKQRIADAEAKRQAAIDADAKAKADAAEKEKADAEAKIQKEAEAKRLKALQPDKEKAVTFINDLVFKSDPPKCEDELVIALLKDFVSDAESLQKSYLLRIENLK